MVPLVINHLLLPVHLNFTKITVFVRRILIPARVVAVVEVSNPMTVPSAEELLTNLLNVLPNGLTTTTVVTPTERKITEEVGGNLLKEKELEAETAIHDTVKRGVTLKADDRDFLQPRLTGLRCLVKKMLMVQLKLKQPLWLVFLVDTMVLNLSQQRQPPQLLQLQPQQQIPIHNLQNSNKRHNQKPWILLLLLVPKQPRQHQHQPLRQPLELHRLSPLPGQSLILLSNNRQKYERQMLLPRNTNNKSNSHKLLNQTNKIRNLKITRLEIVA
jgi:hypothetical protein